MIIDLTNPANPGSCTQAISTHGRTAERIWEPSKPLDEEIQKILRLACMKNRKEICGFITTDEDIWPITNVHGEPYHNFFMDVKETESKINQIYNERHCSIVGIWHTHPTHIPWPSARDLVGWPDPALGWQYWIVTATGVIEWVLIEHDSSVTI